MTEYQTQAKALVEALALRDIRAEHQINDMGGTRDFVNVFAGEPGERYPVHTVWVDADGYTWGRSYEHNLPATGVGPADVAQRIIKTFPEGVK